MKEYSPSIAALRTPLLAFGEALGEPPWRDPWIRRALLFASPEWVRRWEEGQGSAREHRLTFWRYLVRMRCRPTPFGLFAGLTLLRVSAKTSIELAPREQYRPVVRVDFGVLSGVAQKLAEDQDSGMPLLANPCLREHNGFLSYEARTVEKGQVSYCQRRVACSPPLQSVLQRASAPVRWGELVRLLVEQEAVTEGEAKEFIRQLLEEQLLVPACTPPLTAANPLSFWLQETVPWLRPAAKQWVQEIPKLVDEVQAAPSPQTFFALQRHLEEYGVKVAAGELLQVDLWKPAVANRLGWRVVEASWRAVELAASLAPPSPGTPLEDFRQRFLERYGYRDVPLVEVFDPERGLDFGATEPFEPLVADLAPFAAKALAPASFSPRERWLLLQWELCLREGRSVLQLTPQALENFPQHDPLPLPHSLAALVVVAARDEEAVDRGNFCLWLKGAFGPSGARLLGRFCHLDPELEKEVRACLAQEEALESEAVLAETVSKPRPFLASWRAFGRPIYPPPCTGTSITWKRPTKW